MASTTSRARPCSTSTRTAVAICDTSSPRPTIVVTRARVRSGCSARRSSTLRFHDSVSGWLGRPNAVHRLSPGDSVRSAMKPPATDEIDAAARQRQDGARESAPPRPAVQSIRCPPTRRAAARCRASGRRGRCAIAARAAADPSTSETGCPSMRASRTIRPAGICTRVQPSRITSIVSSARPGDRVVLDAEVVVDARQRGIDRWRCGLAGVEGSRARAAPCIRQRAARPSHRERLVRLASALPCARGHTSAHTPIAITCRARVIAFSFSLRPIHTTGPGLRSRWHVFTYSCKTPVRSKRLTWIMRGAAAGNGRDYA